MGWRDEKRRTAAAVATVVLLAMGASGCGERGGGEAGEGFGAAAPRGERPAPSPVDLGAPANAATRALYDGDFQAFGVLSGVGAGEGAWELTLSDQYAQLLRPGLEEVVSYQVAREVYAQGLRATAGPLSIILRNAACAAPNGEAFDYAATVMFEDVAYDGCARRGILGPGERATWAVSLLEVLPAIDACLARVRARPARVTLASVLPTDADEPALAAVRLREADQVRRECYATLDGGEVRAFDALGEADVRAGEGDPELTRAPGPAPQQTSCRDVQEAFGEEGETIGWLARRVC